MRGWESIEVEFGCTGRVVDVAPPILGRLEWHRLRVGVGPGLGLGCEHSHIHANGHIHMVAAETRARAMAMVIGHRYDSEHG